MIRITGGEWCGRNIHTPPGQATRPTPSRVRQAIFNILRDDVRDCAFYDFYAGSGAVGIEALSRGAYSATFYESSRKAKSILQTNLQTLGCGECARIIDLALPGAIRTLPLSDELYPIFFLDPPYNQNLAEGLMEALAERLAECGVPASICLAQTERDAAMPQTIGSWSLRKSYPHGDTTLWLFYGDAATG